MKTNAESTDSIAWPTLSVPGISSSGTRRHARKIAVVVANDPMPSVSKNTVTKPVTSSSWTVGSHAPAAAGLAQARNEHGGEVAARARRAREQRHPQGVLAHRASTRRHLRAQQHERNPDEVRQQQVHHLHPDRRQQQDVGEPRQQLRTHGEHERTPDAQAQLVACFGQTRSRQEQQRADGDGDCRMPHAQADQEVRRGRQVGAQALGQRARRVERVAERGDRAAGACQQHAETQDDADRRGPWTDSRGWSSCLRTTTRPSASAPSAG